MLHWQLYFSYVTCVWKQMVRIVKGSLSNKRKHTLDVRCHMV